MATGQPAEQSGAGDPRRLLVGAMSGTSADGVDAALVRIRGRGLGMSAELIRLHSVPYEMELRRAIFAMRSGAAVTWAEIARVGREITLAYARCINALLAEAGVSAAEVEAIAAHGQTMYHAPPDTIQWIDPALLAEQTRCAVVSDFRRADCAAGGQGAPLVAFGDWLMYRDERRNRVLLNVGGIANLTYIPAGAGIGDIMAFDTGPGNCLSDSLCRERDPGGPGYDSGGKLALAGTEDFRVAFMGARNEYVFRKPPKSTDTAEMIAVYRDALHAIGQPRKLNLADELATASSMMAQSVAMSLDLFAGGWDSRVGCDVLVSGGGTRNEAIMRDLKHYVGRNDRVFVTALSEEAASSKEAVAFALLGAATLDGEPSNVPSCTGARGRVVLGSLTARGR